MNPSSNQTSIPWPLKIIVIVGAIAAILFVGSSLLFAFFMPIQAIFSVVFGILAYISLIGLWKMKRWALWMFAIMGVWFSIKTLGLISYDHSSFHILIAAPILAAVAYLIVIRKRFV